MNWDKGLKRITLALSIIGAVLCAVFINKEIVWGNWIGNTITTALGALFGFWVFYATIKWCAWPFYKWMPW